MARWLAYSDSSDSPQGPLDLVKWVALQVNHTGSDVRILTGEPLSKRGAHGSIRAWWLVAVEAIQGALERNIAHQPPGNENDFVDSSLESTQGGEFETRGGYTLKMAWCAYTS